MAAVTACAVSFKPVSRVTALGGQAGNVRCTGSNPRLHGRFLACDGQNAVRRTRLPGAVA